MDAATVQEAPAEKTPYRVFFVNFGYYSVNEGRTLNEAIRIASRAGWQSRIDCDGKPVATYHPVDGWREI